VSHQVLPPNELLKKWEDMWFNEAENADVLLIQAFQAGADQELEACCNIALTDPVCGTKHQRYMLVRNIREQRRPDFVSLKKQAMGALFAIATGDDDDRDLYHNVATIRQALEQLPG
jgi:hypothetical protein